MTNEEGQEPEETPVTETDQYQSMVNSMSERVDTLMQDGKLYVNVDNLKELVNYIAYNHRIALATGVLAAAPHFFRGQTMITLMLMSIIDAAIQNNAEAVDLSAELKEGMAEIEAMLRGQAEDGTTEA